jgi:hypothetical protein
VSDKRFVDPYGDRRFRDYELDLEFLAMVIDGLTRHEFVQLPTGTDGIPDGSHLVSAWVSEHRRSIVLRVWHESFDPVHPSCNIQVFQPSVSWAKYARKTMAELGYVMMK